MEDELKEIRNAIKSLRDVYAEANSVSVKEEKPRLFSSIHVAKAEGQEMIEVIPNVFISALVMAPPSNLIRNSARIARALRIGAVAQFAIANTALTWERHGVTRAEYTKVEPRDNMFLGTEVYEAFRFMDRMITLGKNVLIVGHSKAVSSVICVAYLEHRGFFDGAALRAVEAFYPTIDKERAQAMSVVVSNAKKTSPKALVSVSGGGTSLFTSGTSQKRSLSMADYSDDEEDDEFEIPEPRKRGRPKKIKKNIY